MLNPFHYVERLMEFQHRYAPVVPLHIMRVPHGWMSAEWLCGHYLYDMIVYEDEDHFEIGKREIKTPSDFLPSLKGYYETISFKWSCTLFDEIEFTGKGYSKEILCEKPIKIQTIKEQCFK